MEANDDIEIRSEEERRPLTSIMESKTQQLDDILIKKFDNA